MFEDKEAEIKSYMEDGLISIEGDKKSLAQTGEPYDVLALAIALSLEDIEDKKITISEACRDLIEVFKEAFNKYKADHVGNTIYWRKYPKIWEEGDFETDSKRVKITARILISDRPILSEEELRLAHDVYAVVRQTKFIEAKERIENLVVEEGKIPHTIMNENINALKNYIS